MATKRTATQTLDALLEGRAGVAGVDRAERARTLEALELVTADAEGWPHVAWLSAGELLRMGDRLRLCLWRSSGTAAGLGETGRALLHGVVGGEVCTVRLEVFGLSELRVGDARLAAFEARPVDARSHAVPYATVVGGAGFRLHEPGEVVARWREQLAALGDATRSPR